MAVDFQGSPPFCNNENRMGGNIVRHKESEEMYLETILLLQQNTGYVRSVDIATELGYSKASISRAMKILLTKEYITIGKHGEILLTEEGQARAEKVYETHRIIMEILVRIGADKTLAEENACRIEHVIDDELLELIKKHLTNMKPPLITYLTESFAL